MAVKKITKKKEVKEMVVKKSCCGLPCKTVVLIHAGVLLAILVFAGVAFKKYWNVAEVNGKGIKRIDYYKMLDKQGGKQVLEGMIQEAMIVQEVNKKGIKIEQSVIDADLAKVEDQIKAQGLTLESALESQGMTKDDLVKQIRLKRSIAQIAKPATESTQAEIDKFIADNKTFLPQKATKEELEKIAKEQLTTEANNKAITDWLAELKKNAKIEYK